MNVSGIKAKAPAKNEASPGSLSWGLVHEVTGPHATAVKAVAALGDGSALFTSGKTGIRRWDALKASSEELVSAQAAGGLVHILAVVAGSRLWAGFGDGRVAVFDIETGKALHKFPGHKGEIVSIAASRGGDTIFTGGIDFQVKMWSPDGEARGSSGHHHGAVNSMLVLDEEGELWAGSADGSISIMPRAGGAWAVSEDSAAFLKHSSQKAVSCLLAVGEDAVWAGCDDGVVVVWGRQEKAVRGSVQGHSARVSCLTTLGHHVWSGGADKAIVGYDAASMTELYRLPDQGSFVKDMVTLGWAVWAFNAKNCRLYTSDTCVAAEAGRADEAESRVSEGEAREAALRGELGEAQRQLQEQSGAAEEKESLLRKELEELEEQRTAEVGALKSGADVDKQGLLEQLQALAAEKSELENRLEDATSSATEAEEARQGQEEKGRAEKAKAEAALEEARAASKADEVRHMEKVAALEDDKARTISAMVEDKNQMIDRIRSDLDAQNRVVAAAKEAQAAAEERESALRGELESSRADAARLEQQASEAQEKLQAAAVEKDAAVSSAREEGGKHLEGLEAERKRLAEAQAALEAERKKSAGLADEVADRDRKLSEREAAQSGADARVAALEAELAELKAAKEALTTNLSAGGKESANLKGELTKAKKAAADAAAAAEKSNAENGRLSEDLKAAKQDLAKAAEDKKALATATAGVAAGEKQAGDLRTQLEAAKAEQERLAAELAAAKDEATSLKAAEEEARRLLREESDGKVQERELALEAAAKKEEEAKSGAGQLEEVNKGLKQRLEELEEELKQAKSSEQQQREALEGAEEKQRKELAVHKTEIERLSEIANQVSGAEARAAGLAAAAAMAEKHLTTAEHAGWALQEEKKLRRAAEDQLLHAQGQIEELRRELSEKGTSAGNETEELRAEIDAAHKELNGVLDDRYQLQVALKAAQKQLEGGREQSRGRTKELEGALKQAAKDYQVLLKQNHQLKNEAAERDCDLQATAEQLAYFQSEVARLGGLVGYFEGKAADVARVVAEADHQRRTLAKMQEINEEMQARARIQALPPPQPARQPSPPPPPQPESPRPRTPPEPQRSFTGRERMIPPCGFMG